MEEWHADKIFINNKVLKLKLILLLEKYYPIKHYITYILIIIIKLLYDLIVHLSSTPNNFISCYNV